MRELIRRVILRPYLKGKGPSFVLRMFDTGTTSRTGQHLLAYELTMREGRKSTVLFSGDDYGCSPMHAIDSDASVEGLLSFLTLRPGDTDADYFADYTEAQLNYCAQHAESLSVEVSARFGEG